MITPAIEDSFEKFDVYPSVTERYFTQYHVTPLGAEQDESHCVLVHSNRICLVTLAETHPIVRDKKTVNKIDFRVTDKVDRRDNKVTGKGKKGAQYIQPDSLLCFVECSDSTRYAIYGCVKGKLVEVNENLFSNMQLLVDKPLSDGFIAIILPNLKDIEEQKKGFSLCSTAKNGKSNVESLDID